ncbi:anti-sigma factor [Streptomyces sp. RKND-216]|uniref:anti-sigma factor n=1 Tax=Streptomyces sp. RKND-216 TaxID=2562581 RepID=UPI0014473078|nr:anti-sigma factor [Streptomyces sp. RKND-216]
MRHIDPADLAAHALDGQAATLAPWQTGHLRHCDACIERLASFQRVAHAGRSLTAEDLPVPAPPRVWEALLADVTKDARTRGATRGDTGGASAATDRETPAATGLTRNRRTWRTSRCLAGVASVVCLVLGGAAAGSAATWWEMRQPETSPTAAGARALTPPKAGGAGGTGEARGEVQLVRDGAPGRVRVTVHGLPSTAGYYEVWLMDRTHRKLIPLGTLGTGGSSTLTLPKGVDTDVYALLDVSAQPYDGTTAHSGRSVVRGSLPLTGRGGAAGA